MPKVAPADLGEQKLAESIESLFLRRGRTLTDPDDAEGYDIALEAVLLMLDGIQARGVIDDSQYARIAALYEGMKRAPRHL
ncbi:hypothetical protein [Streptomyces sp. NPDC060243]|uniref:hypothetical protein n=1 Tax=Streptomyces sp. NPDC060243 TaxID=3347081 RepID=UPI00365650BE